LKTTNTDSYRKVPNRPNSSS